MSTNPINSLAEALYSALFVDLSEIEYQYRYPGTRETETRKRRPQEYDVQVHHFEQTWSDTSLGFGGVAGQAGGIRRWLRQNR